MFLELSRQLAAGEFLANGRLWHHHEDCHHKCEESVHLLADIRDLLLPILRTSSIFIRANITWTSLNSRKCASSSVGAFHSFCVSYNFMVPLLKGVMIRFTERDLVTS